MTKQIDITFKPFPKQYKAMEFLDDKVTQQILYGGSAGSGKSLFGCAWIVIQCLRYPGTRWMIGRSKLGQLRSTTMKTFTDLCKEWNIIQGEHYTWNGMSNEIKFYNGSEVVLKDLFFYPSDPDFDSLGSLELTGAFIDEASQIVQKARDVVTSRLRYKLNEYDIIGKVLMTCNPSKNFLYRDFYLPHSKNELESHKQFIPALPTDNPTLPESYLETLRNMDSVSKERLLYGNWEYDDDPTCLMNYIAICDLFTNYHISTLSKDRYISADIARMGSDSTVLIVWEGFKVIEIQKHNKIDTTESARIICELQTKYNVHIRNVVIDTDGIGGGVADQLKGSNNFLNGGRPKNNENYLNLKSQCYFKLASMVNKAEIWIDINNGEYKEKITKELEQIKQGKIDQEGKLQVISKAEMKEKLGRSPDFADTLMMRMIYTYGNSGTYSMGSV